MNYKQLLILITLFFLTACPENKNTGSFSNYTTTQASSITTCTGGSTLVLNPSEYFPIMPRSRWEYSGSYDLGQEFTSSYSEVVNVIGTRIIHGVQTTIIRDGNSNESYISIDKEKGIKDWTKVLDGTASVPLDVVAFPISNGRVCTQSFSNFDFGPDRYNPSSHTFGTLDIIVTIETIGTKTVPAGTFADTIRITTLRKTKINGLNETSEEIFSYARNVGLIAKSYSSSREGFLWYSSYKRLNEYYIPIEHPSTCTIGDAVIASMGYGAEYYPLDTYSAIMMDSYTTVNTDPPQKHTTLIENKGLFNIQGIPVQHTHKIRSSFPPVVTDTYTSTDSLGAYDWTHLASQASLQPLSPPTPLTLVQFPLSTNAQCSQTVTNINFGDLDFDGTDDIGYIEFSSDIYSFGTTTPNTFKINNVVKRKARLSSGNIETNIINSTEWRAPQVGLIKKTTASNKTNTYSSTPTLISTEDTQINSFLKLPYAANDIVYDVYSNKLYASINSAAPTFANHVVGIDPATGIITNSVVAGINPGPLTLSDDGGRLYVGMVGEPNVRSINLPTMTLNPSFSLGSDFLFRPFHAEDLAVVPGDPYSVAVAKFDMPNRNHLGITVYKNGTPLTNSTTSLNDGNIIVFGTSNQLFGLPIHTVPQGLTVYNVDASGISLNASYPSSGIGFEAVFAGGLLYGSNGKVFNPLTQLSTQDFIFSGLSNGASVMVNTAANNITFLIANQRTIYGQPYNIQSFDLTTKASIATNKPYLFQYYDGINSFDLSANTIQDMGTNGFAFRVFETFNSLPSSEWSIIIQK